MEGREKQGWREGGCLRGQNGVTHIPSPPSPHPQHTTSYIHSRTPAGTKHVQICIKDMLGISLNYNSPSTGSLYLSELFGDDTNTGEVYIERRNVLGGWGESLVEFE